MLIDDTSKNYDVGHILEIRIELQLRMHSIQLEQTINHCNHILTNRRFVEKRIFPHHSWIDERKGISSSIASGLGNFL